LSLGYLHSLVDYIAAGAVGSVGAAGASVAGGVAGVAGVVGSSDIVVSFPAVSISINYAGLIFCWL